MQFCPILQSLQNNAGKAYDLQLLMAVLHIITKPFGAEVCAKNLPLSLTPIPKSLAVSDIQSKCCTFMIRTQSVLTTISVNLKQNTFLFQYVIGIFAMRNNSLWSASYSPFHPCMWTSPSSNGSRLFQFSRRCSFQLLLYVT